MRRHLTTELEKWKQNPLHKPLLLMGARQVGKTWLLQEFGKQSFAQVVYIRFDRDERMKESFSQDYDMKRLVTSIELHAGCKLIADETLLILDEIQECPAALTSLKYFCEDMRELHVAAAGSLLGLHEHQGTGFPVGKVNMLNLYPMSFTEFLEAAGQKSMAELLATRDWKMITLFADRLSEYLRYYYYVGGMPEAVLSFATERDFNKVRDIQADLLAGYKRDFSKHAPVDVWPRINLIWESIPNQLSQQNKKFMCSAVQKGTRMRELELALQWLQDAGLTYMVRRVSKPGIPAAAYSENAFKLFHLDVGLLGAQTGLQAQVILEGNRIFQEFKGALAEQFVQQELRAEHGLTPYYWTASNGQSEIDFLVQYGMELIPIEVKAELNLTAKSLKSYCQKFAPGVAVRTSLANHHIQQSLPTATPDKHYSQLDIPLYALSQLIEELKSL
ncbi:MAG: ATP-binding protein [Akkermansia sp.]|nr:ATP-binding protein [Akkermansia sp.]